jgi:tetratricopeptide (TPR) repeat protein
MIDIHPDDIDLQARYWASDVLKTWRWDGYDKWRKSLSPSVANKSPNVYQLDRQRAWAHRDFDEVMRLANSPPEQYLDTPLDRLYLQFEKIDVYLAKGDRPRAKSIARNVLEEVKKFARDSPDDSFLWAYSAYAHAVLGEREAAFADYDRERKAAVAEMGHYNGTLFAENDLLTLYALLGDRELALQELRKQVNLPIAPLYYCYVFGTLVSLWDDPRFKAIANDRANDAPLPLENVRLPVAAAK